MNVIDRPAHRVNELDPQMLALHALSPTSAYSAPARGTMFAGHFSQRPVISGSEPQLTQSGIADEFGKYTFSVKMPEDGIICRIIPRYAPGIGEENIAVEHESPEILVIYRKKDTGEYDYFMLPYYMSNHPTFGFKFEPRPALDYLKVGYQIDKDTVFLDTPANKGESHYTFGRNLNVIYMSHPSVGLDGYVISRDVLPYYSFKVYETRTIDIGANTIPLNLYGDNDTYKPFPELGEYILESGLLMATRKFDPYMAPAILSQRDLQTVDWVHDKKVFSRPGKGKVIDINIIRSENINRQLPEEMTKQLQKYANAGQRYHRDIVRFEEQIIKESRDMGNDGRISISPALQCLLRTSKGIINYGASRHKQPLTLTYKREPLDTWRATFTIEYEIIPERGFKFTCGSGGKGVVCMIEEPENMPVDADGNRADIISGPDSVPGRMNLGRMYEPYFNGMARDVRRQILEEMGFDRHTKKMTMEELMSVPPAMFDKGVATLLKYYSIVSPRSYKEYTEYLTPEERYQWLLYMFNTHLYNYISNEFDKEPDLRERNLFLDEMVIELERNFKTTYGPVTYVGRSGRKIVTKNNFRISPLYIMLLDKIADTWLSCDIGKNSNFGLLAALNQNDKYSVPWRKTPPRTIGVTEGRLFNMYGGREMIAEMMDRSGNIASQREISRQVIHAENPMNIERIIDRQKIQLGNARPNQMLHHIFRCTGFDVVYKSQLPTSKMAG